MLVGSRKSLEARPKTLLFKHIVRKIFLEDWVLKLIALAITLALWLGVTVFTKQGSGRFTVPLNIRPSVDAILTSSGVKDVTIRVRRDDQKIRDLYNRPGDIHISLDLGDVEPGEKVITIDPQSVSHDLPSGVRLEDIQPRNIPVKLEVAEQKDVPVRADIQGEPARGFEVYPNETISPQKITIRGPASYIRALDYVSTNKIDVTGKTGDFVANQVPIRIANDYATPSDKVVNLSVHIGEKRVERVFLVPVSGSSGKRAVVVLFAPPTAFVGVRAENLKVEMVKNPAGEESANLILPDVLQESVEVKSIKIRP